MNKKHPRAKLDHIQQFVNKKHIAVVGISRNPKKFGNAAFKELIKNQYTVYPVHPEMEEFEGVKCYKKISDLPAEVQAVFVSTKPAHSFQLVKEAHEKGITLIWLQQGSQHDDAVNFAVENNMTLIQRQCILMFANPVAGIHKFHRSINKLFGVYPK